MGGVSPHTRNENLFEDYSYTECANSQTEHEPQGGEKSERRSTTNSTRMRGILSRSRHAVEVARLSADLYCQQPVCRSLLATN